MSWTRRDFKPRRKLSDLRSMRVMGVRDVNVYCSNPPRCYHQAKLNLDDWNDDVIFGELERQPAFTGFQLAALKQGAVYEKQLETFLDN